MRKIPTALVRDENDRRYVTDEVTPGCEWVFAGEGAATRKYDGTCVMLRPDGSWWARREVKPGKESPAGWVLSEYDDVTGKAVGWEPIEQSPFAKYFLEAPRVGLEPGTYELCGPRVNGNPEGLESHELIEHATAAPYETRVSHTVDEVKNIVAAVRILGWEGIVWHHPDGRMAKLKVRDLRASVNAGES